MPIQDGRTIDPVHALNHSMPPAKRVMLGDRILELQTNFNTLITTINNAGVTGLSIPTSLEVNLISSY